MFEALDPFSKKDVTQTKTSFEHGSRVAFSC